MRLAASLLLGLCVLFASSGCKTESDRQKEEYDKNQAETMQKLLKASIEHDGGAPSATADHGEASAQH